MLWGTHCRRNPDLSLSRVEDLPPAQCDSFRGHRRRFACGDKADAAGNVAATADATADENAAPQKLALIGCPKHMDAVAGKVIATADNSAPQKGAPMGCGMDLKQRAGQESGFHRRAARLASALRGLVASLKPLEERSSATLPSPIGNSTYIARLSVEFWKTGVEINVIGNSVASFETDSAVVAEAVGGQQRWRE